MTRETSADSILISKLSGPRLNIMVWLFFCLALFVTNSAILPTDHLTRISAYDTWIYLQIADAAPGVPPSGSDLIYHGAMRFLFPYTLGLLAKVFDVSSWTMFRIASHLLISLTIGVFWSITGQLSKSLYLRLIATAVLCFQVYLFRLQLAFSGFVNDTLFILGFSLAILTTLNQQRFFLFLSILLMGISKQTVFFVLPVFAAFSFVGHLRRSELQRWFRYWFLATTVLIAYYWTIHTIVLPFSSPTSTSSMILGLATYFTDKPFTEALKGFLVFAGLGVFGGLGPILFFAAIWIKSQRKFSPLLLWFVGLFLLSIVQPILSGPLITDRNIMRLESIGAVPLVLLALQLAEESKLTLRRGPCIFGVSLLFLASFHHLFSVVGPDQSLRIIFAVAHIALLLAFSCSLLKFIESQGPQKDLTT